MNSAHVPDDQGIAAFDPDTDAFFRAVSAGAPEDVEVETIDGGFDLVYRNKLTQNGIAWRVDSSFRAIVKCDTNTLMFSILDVGVVEYVNLVQARLSKGVTAGRANAWRNVDAFGQLPDGSIGKVGTQRQDTRVFHKAVRDAAATLGWVEKQPIQAMIGKVVAGVAVGGLVVGGLVVAVLAIMGRLG